MTGEEVENFGSISRTKNSFVVHSSGEYVAFITSALLKIYNNDTKSVQVLEPFHKKSEKKLLTAVAFHPEALTIATGLVDGSIFLWNEWKDNKPIMVKLHWHHTPVIDIMFTIEGKTIDERNFKMYFLWKKF